MTKLLFLDVDGVLNRCGQSGHGLEDDKVALLKTIVDATGCGIVLSSTWRKKEHQLERIRLMCRQSLGVELLGVTPDLARKQGDLWLGTVRGNEVKQWLLTQWKEEQWPVFVILDDDADMGDLLPHLVRTHSFTGLTPEIAAEVIRRFNQPTTP